MDTQILQLTNWGRFFRTYKFDLKTNKYSRFKGEERALSDGFIKFCIASPPIVLIKDENKIWHYVGRRALIKIGKKYSQFAVKDHGPISFARLVSNGRSERLHVYTQFLYFAGHLIDPLFDEFDRQMEDFSLFLSRISNE